MTKQKIEDALYDIMQNTDPAKEALMELSFSDIMTLINRLHNAIDGHTEEAVIQSIKQYESHLAHVRQMALNLVSDLGQRMDALRT